jgi:hypothetical protein
VTDEQYRKAIAALRNHDDEHVEEPLVAELRRTIAIQQELEAELKTRIAQQDRFITTLQETVAVQRRAIEGFLGSLKGAQP